MLRERGRASRRERARVLEVPRHLLEPVPAIDVEDEPSSVFSPPTQDEPSGPAVAPPDTKPPVQPAPKTEAQQRTLQSFFAAR